MEQTEFEITFFAGGRDVFISLLQKQKNGSLLAMEQPAMTFKEDVG